MTITKQNTILPAGRIKLDSRKITVSEQPRHEPQVTLKREGAVIRAIEIRCACGDQIILDCQYETE